MDKDHFMAAEKLKAVYEILGDFFESPCNYGFVGESIDEYMMDHAELWCEDNCGRVADAACWQKFLELKIEERKR